MFLFEDIPVVLVLFRHLFSVTWSLDSSDPRKRRTKILIHLSLYRPFWRLCTFSSSVGLCLLAFVRRIFFRRDGHLPFHNHLPSLVHIPTLPYLVLCIQRSHKDTSGSFSIGFFSSLNPSPHLVSSLNTSSPPAFFPASHCCISSPSGQIDIYIRHHQTANLCQRNKDAPVVSFFSNYSEMLRLGKYSSMAVFKRLTLLSFPNAEAEGRK